MEEITRRAPFRDRRTGSLRVRLVALVATAMLASSCASSAPGPTGPASIAPNPTVTANATVAPNPTPSPNTTMTAPPTVTASGSGGGKPQFPMTVTDDEGTQLTLPSEPQRIVSLSPANTEIVFTLGEGAKVVGGTPDDDYPPGAGDPPDVISATTVVIEEVVALQPDLILAAGDGFTPEATIQQLRALGLHVLVVYAGTVDQVLADIDLIGNAIGVGEAATTLTDQMETRVQEVTAAAAAETSKPRTFYEIDASDAIYGPAPDSFLANMIQLAGGVAVTTADAATYEIPLEDLVRADPEVIVLGDADYGACPNDVVARPGWGQMTAVHDGAIRPIDDTIVTRPGPRIGEGLAALAAAIHPDLVLTPPPPAPPAPAC